MLNFDEPTKTKFNSIIKVIGVGGGGSNAVNHMYKLGISGVDFIVCNTDKQALEISPIPHKIQLGVALTEGLGAGAVPEVGKNAALESIEDIRKILSNNTKMVFITAGMGGGTGTGAAPVIAKTAKELGILTVGIVTIPFGFEGRKRKTQAEAGINEIKESVDTLIVVSNDKLREIHGNLKLVEAFSKADDVLTIAAKSIAEVIDYTLHINLDFNDIRTVMTNSGVAVMGSAITSGANRAINAVEQALSSPLLNDSDIRGARYVLLNVTSGTDELTMDELGEINDYIQEAAGQSAEIIQGVGSDPNLGEQIKVTIIATGFKDENNVLGVAAAKPEIKRVSLIDETPTVVQVNVAPVVESQQAVEEKKEKPLYEEPFLKTISLNEEVTPIIETTVELITPITEEKIEHSLHEKLSLENISEINNENTFNSNIETEITNEVSFEITNSITLEVNEPQNESATVVHTLGEDDNFTTELKENINSQANIEEAIQPIAEPKGNVIYDLGTSNSITEREQTTEESNKINSTEDYLRKTQDRIQKLKELSFKLKNGKTLNDLETEPAYIRRGINLNTPEHSSENNISRYTLGENDEKKGEIRPNNSYLHDQAD
ncbi:MAG: cell division protein FtsZ [Bacteroidia bacterium]|nr:cell division protein FtsZ [Bacteroidia bacterium]